MSSRDLDELKIPAFQRKKELARKASRKLAWTALDRQKEALLKEKNRVNKYSKSVPVARPAFSAPMALSAQPSLQSPSSKVLSKRIVPEISEPVSSRFDIVGEVTHYLEKIQVAIIKLSRQLKQGNFLAFEEEKGLFFQEVASMQINRKDVKTAKKGSEIGMKVTRAPKIKGRVYLAK